MRGTEPLPKAKREQRATPDAPQAPAAKPQSKPDKALPKKSTDAKAERRPPPKPPVVVETSTKLPPGRRSSVAGLDRRNAQRLRRGQMPIDATLDLHGMTRQAAHGALAAFVRAGAARGHRCVLVITGKGAPREGGDGGFMPDRSTGILRAEVPRWLGEAGLKPYIVAWTPATAKHGGSGALYVLLRRQRDER